MTRLWSLLAVLLLALPLTGWSAETDLAKLRAAFQDAERALQKGQQAQYERLVPKLRHYPLYPYLLQAELRRRLDQVQPDEIAAFGTAYRDSPLATRLKAAWLAALARNGRWQSYLEAYEGEGEASLQCLYLRALFNTGRKQEALDAVEPLWLAAKEQPESCDPLFAAWTDAGRLTAELAWARFGLAMGAGQSSLASQLMRHLAPERKKLAKLWLEVRQQPGLILSKSALKRDSAPEREVVAYGLKRMAQLHPEEAWSAWEQLRGRYAFTVEERSGVERRIALSQLLLKERQALQRLDTLELGGAYVEVQEWRVRAALSFEDWEASIAWIDRMDEVTRAQPRWLYWRARALESLGQKERAAALYADVATGRTYYGFMASDRLNRPYSLNNVPLSYTKEQLEAVERIPGVERARELLALGRTTDARREWLAVMRDLDEQRLAQAAKLAQRWGWHDRAVITVSRTSLQDDLELRFPLPYREQVFDQVEQHQVDPAWAFAIMRQESAFIPDVRSPAGALGLMQLMPQTGREVARSLRAQVAIPNQLLDPKTNIRLGVKHLRQVLDRFSGNVVLATAAYNAGQHRVRSWLPSDKSVAADVWVDTVPFSETREYMKNVLSYTVVYEYRLGKDPVPLRKRMPAVTYALLESGRRSN